MYRKQIEMFRSKNGLEVKIRCVFVMVYSFIFAKHIMMPILVDLFVSFSGIT